nr:YigZ family protein [Arthrobacter roseus]
MVSESGSACGTYTTLAGHSRNEIDIKRSRFIALLTSIDSEEAARDHIAAARREFPDARHHCSAYVVGPHRHLQRTNDDGEPSGTAGQPMMEALIRSQSAGGATDLSDIVAVTVRYFGGTLLGTGGLARAYSGSVTAALAASTFRTRRRVRNFSVMAAHENAGRLEHELRSTGVTISGIRYTSTGAELDCAVLDEPARTESFLNGVAIFGSGAIEPVDHGTSWMDHD